jgi:bifunctional DNase/RNase
MIKMELARIVISETSDEQVIVLRDAGGERAFPIVIGIFEAVAIDRNLKGKKTPRPMTHDLLENVIRGLDATLDRIHINDLKERTFFASLILKRNGKRVEVDSRPSDAIALAVLMKAPIYVEEKVLRDVATSQDSPGSEDEESNPEGDEGEGEETAGEV